MWDYPRPPRVEPTGAHVVVEHAGLVIADSRRALRVLETSQPPAFYVPPDDVRTDLLLASSTRTVCEWKGVATYWHLDHGEIHVDDVAWSYPTPAPGFEPIAGHLAFYAQKVDACWVDGDRVQPNPGSFYGGWITSRIVGPFKGGAGTLGW